MNAFDTAHTDTAAAASRHDAIYQKLELLFNEIITVRTDDAALKKLKVIASDLSIENWDWSQGVGIYGIWRLYQVTGEQRYLDYVLAWYQRRLAEGLPEKNINRMAPMLTLTTMGIAQDTREHEALIEEYAHWIEHELLRTQENGFTHCTSDHLNEEQLWVDTLFMSGLFYARASTYLNRPTYSGRGELSVPVAHQIPDRQRYRALDARLEFYRQWQLRQGTVGARQRLGSHQHRRFHLCPVERHTSWAA